MKNSNNYKREISFNHKEEILFELNLIESRISGAATIIKGYIVAILAYIFAIKVELDKLCNRNSSYNSCLQGIFSTISNLCILNGSIILLKVAESETDLEIYNLKYNKTDEVIFVNTEVSDGLALFVISNIIQSLGSLLNVLNSCKTKSTSRSHSPNSTKEKESSQKISYEELKETKKNIFLTFLDILASLIIIKYNDLLITSALKAREIELNKLNGVDNSPYAPYIETELALFSKQGVLLGSILLTFVIFVKLISSYNKTKDSQNPIKPKILTALGLVLYVRSYLLISFGLEESLYEEYMNILNHK